MLILVFLTLIIITALGLYSWSEQKKQRQHVLGLIGVRQAQSKDEKGKNRGSKTPTAKLSQKDIAKKLNEDNYLSLKGKKFTESIIYKMIKGNVGEKRKQSELVYSDFKIKFVNRN